MPVKAILVLIGIGAIVLGLVASHFYAFHNGKAVGAFQERIVWEEAKRKLLVDLEIQRKKFQAKIDFAAVQYAEAKAKDVAKIDALEDAIKVAADEIEPEDLPPKCRAWSPNRGVLRKLNEIGR